LKTTETASLKSNGSESHAEGAANSKFRPGWARFQNRKLEHPKPVKRLSNSTPTSKLAPSLCTHKIKNKKIKNKKQKE